MGDKSESNWIRKSFLMDSIAPSQASEKIKLKVPLRKVLEAVPLSILGASLLELELNQEEWHKLASSDELRAVAEKWSSMIEGSNLLVTLPRAFDNLTGSFKTFRAFKESPQFRMLTSDISVVEVADVHNYSDTIDVEILFSGRVSSTASGPLKKKILKLVRDREHLGLSNLQVALRIFGLLLTLAGSNASSLLVKGFYIAEKAVALDGLVGAVCRVLPPEPKGWSVYTSLCRAQKGQDIAQDGVWLVKSANVNLRAEPASSSESLGKVQPLQTFTPLDDPENNGWIKVSLELDGVRMQGWIYKKFVAFKKPDKK